MKKVWKYIIITLLLLLGLCCAGVLYLFFVPGSTLFNITYIYKSKTIKKAEPNISVVDKVVVNSRAYDVNILSTQEKEISVEVYANSFGFVMKQNKEANVTTTFKNNTLTFEISEPHGFALKNNSYVNLYIPKTKEIDLSVSNLKATTVVNNPELTIKNLYYSTTSGKCTLTNCKVNGTFDLNLNEGSFTISESATTNNNDVLLKMQAAKFDAASKVLGNVSITENDRGIVYIKECNGITDKVKSAGGQIHIEKAAHVNISTSDTDLYINEITDGAVIDLTKSGDININTISGASTLSTHSGKISISKANSSLLLKSNTGNITVETAYLTMDVKTEYGTISINYAEDAESYSQNINARKVIAKLKDGKINVTGVENIIVTIEDNARANINMKNVYGTNSIAGNRGAVKVVVDKNAQYVLSTETATGHVRVNLTQTTEYNGYKTKAKRETKVNCSSSSNTLSVTTKSGDLTVLDTNFA